MAKFRDSQSATAGGLSISGGEIVGHLLDLRHGLAVKSVQIVAVDVDLGEDLATFTNEDDQLGAGLAGAGQVIGGPGNIGDVDVPILRHGGAADPATHGDEDMVGGGAQEGTEPQHVIGIELVDSGPVEPGIGLMQQVHSLGKNL